MIFEIIARYYKYLILLFVGLACLKVILVYFFHDRLQGLMGLVFAVFKWWSEDEQEMADTESDRRVMRMHNVVTIFMFLALAVVIAATFLPKFLG